MLVSKKELANLKLRAIKSDDLKELAGILGIDARGTASNLIKNLLIFRKIKLTNLSKENIRSKLEKDKNLFLMKH